MRPVIALLSDFGARDHYAGTMKGVILGICPDATLVDITHDVTPHDVLEGALQLAASYKYFPAGTVFLAVVDPGVGSARRGIAAEAGDYRFVAPDNGVLTAVLKETPPRKVVELSERRFARPTVTRTFEGRDRFAPAAAWLAKGTQLGALGRAVGEYHRLDLPSAAAANDALTGTVVHVDRFGNLVTSIDRRTFESFARPSPIRILIAGRAIERLVSTYAEIGAGEVCALFGSSDHLEFAANAVSAAAQLGLDRGATVEIRRS
jgi:S-adenosyl-L-methionine hydrolase (adenosine-forming)